MKILILQICDVMWAKGSNISGRLDLSKGHSVDSVTERELLVLLCSEKAVYVYSLMHIVQVHNALACPPHLDILLY